MEKLWQRIKEYSSGINLSFWNLLRRRDYEEFDNEDILPLNGTSCEESEILNSDGYSSIDLHSCSDSNQTNKSIDTPQDESVFRENCQNLCEKQNVSDSFSSYQSKGLLHGVHSDENKSLPSTIKEVHNVVHSYSQRKYQRLDDTDDDLSDDEISSDQNTKHSQTVFHSIKDFDRRKHKKSSKVRRRKKIGKRLTKIATRLSKAFIVGHGAPFYTPEDFTFTVPTRGLIEDMVELSKDMGHLIWTESIGILRVEISYEKSGEEFCCHLDILADGIKIYYDRSGDTTHLYTFTKDTCLTQWKSTSKYLRIQSYNGTIKLQFEATKQSSLKLNYVITL